MSETNSSPQSFPLTQRELVGLALRRGTRLDTAPRAPHSQCERVRQALALGLGATAKPGRAASRGIYR